MEDVAKALKFIKEHECLFGVNGDNYIVNPDEVKEETLKNMQVEAEELLDIHQD